MIETQTIRLEGDYTGVASTNPGRIRSRNEDSYIVRPDLGLFGVADGMGGHRKGDVASGICVDSIQRWFDGKVEGAVKKKLLHSESVADETLKAPEQELINSVIFANREIFSLGSSSPAHEGMGTTLVIAMFQGRSVFVVWSGDSRLYRLRKGRLRPVTKDHSLLNEYLKMQMIPKSQERDFPMRNIITKALGLQKRADIESMRVRYEHGDVFLFCSDGLNDMLEDKEISDILCGPGSLNQRAERLIEAANSAGGADNITVVLVQRSCLHPDPCSCP